MTRNNTSDNWKTSAKNFPTIALNKFYLKKRVYILSYISQQNSNHEKQLIILMTSNVERWHYLS